MENNLSIFNFLTPKSETFFLMYKSTLRQVLESMEYHKFTIIPLINEKGEYVTSLSEGDLLRFIKSVGSYDIKMLENYEVSNIEIYRPYQSIKVDASLEDVIELTKRQNFIPVVDDRNMFIGIIKRSTIIEYLSSK